jgi:hypothetical protein
MPKTKTLPIHPFRPTTIEDVFALYLARELTDEVRVRWYARLCNRYSMCLLLNALRAARKRGRSEVVTPEQFLSELEELVEGPLQ